MVSSEERREDGKERTKEPREIILASWGNRFLAWIVDFILVSIALAVLFSTIAIPIWFSYYYDEAMTTTTASARAYQKCPTFTLHYIKCCFLWILDIL
jgi:hypothetical protein